jgi:hypothetical protein
LFFSSSLFLFPSFFFLLSLFFLILRYDRSEEVAVEPTKAPAKKPAIKHSSDLKAVSDSKSVTAVSKKEAEASGTNTTMSGSHGSVISTAFTHMRTVSAFSMHHTVADYYEDLTARIAEARINRGIIGGLGFGGANTVLFLTYALLFWYGATLIAAGKITFLELMTAILTLMMGAFGLGQAMSDMGDQKAGLVIADRIFKDIDEGKESPIDGLSIQGGHYDFFLSLVLFLTLVSLVL